MLLQVYLLVYIMIEINIGTFVCLLMLLAILQTVEFNYVHFSLCKNDIHSDSFFFLNQIA